MGKSLSAPIYTFAEDSCLGYANLILTLGAKCYASIKYDSKVLFR